MEVPPSEALDMSGSPHLTIDYLLRIGYGDLESQAGLGLILDGSSLCRIGARNAC